MGEEEKFVGRGTETRTFLYFKVSTAALREFVPDGWQICPAGYGPAAGANLLAVFVDQVTSLDAEDKPLELMRYVLFEIPVRPAGTGATAWVLFTGLSTGGPGIYGTNLQATAQVGRKIRHGPSGSAVEESWDFEAGGGESVSLQLRFLRGPVSVVQVESRVYSRVWPWFSRIYRVEQATDVVHPAGEPGRLTQVAFKAKSAKLAPLFDGTEQLTAIISVPAYTRRIFLPGSATD